MITQSDRIKLYQNKKQNNSINVSFSSDNTYFELLDDDTKRDIICLIKAGYDKRTIIKLYIHIKPSNANEAIHYLTKENELIQHNFVPSTKLLDECEICGEKRYNHINQIAPSKLSDYTEIMIVNSINPEILEIKKNTKLKNICRICEEEILNEENLITQCEQCHNYFCYECLYLYVKELIKKGKSEIFCPDCKIIYNKEKIEEIFKYNHLNKNEIKDLKYLLEKNITKNLVLSNRDLMFCPITDCQGYANKNNDQKYNICNLGHKFCSKCGESWHKDEKCPEEEEVDRLFQQYIKQLNLKKCPYCQIVTLKKGGCNHIICLYCRKNWCWLCQELFDSTDEHYGNRNNNCYNRMMDNLIENVVCSHCENFVNSLRSFRCGHFICNNCFENYLLENNVLKFKHCSIKIKCMIEECNEVTNFNWINFLKEINNKNIIKKYQFLFVFLNLLFYLREYFLKGYGDYVILFNLLEKIEKYLNNNFKNSKGYIILEILQIFFGLISIIVYVIVFPISLHIIFKKVYFIYLMESIKKYKRLKILIIIGEELLFLIFLFPLVGFHYIYSISLFITALINLIYYMIQSISN